MIVGQCNERTRLLLEYRTATEVHSAAVAELTRRIGTSSVDGYRALSQAVETTRTSLNEARDRLAHHIAEHRREVSNP